MLAFGAIGTLSYLVAYPWREVGYRPLRWFISSWFWLMIVPTLLLVLAVHQRISEYGVTPDRYCLVLFAIWMAGLVVYLGATRGRMDLRVIPVSLGIGLILSSVGPWSAAAVSVRSQLVQLQKALSEKSLLSDGRLRLDPPSMATFTRAVSSNKSITSIVKELYDLDALDRLAPMFSGISDSPFLKPQDAEARLTALGVTRWGTPEATEAPSPPPSPPLTISVESGAYNRLIGPFWFTADGLAGCRADCSWSSTLTLAGLPLKVSGMTLTAGVSGGTATFNISRMVNSKLSSSGRPAQTLTLEALEGRDHGLLMVVEPACAPYTDETHFESWLLLKSPPVAFKAESPTKDASITPAH